MKSAIAVYERISEEFIQKVLSPALKREGYELVDYHIMGDSRFPDHTLIGIKTTSDSKKTPRETLEKIGEEAGQICQQIDQEERRESRLEPESIWLRNFQMPGEYNNPDTAAQLFLTTALKYEIQATSQATSEMIEEFQRNLKSLTSRLTG